MEMKSYFYDSIRRIKWKSGIPKEEIASLNMLFPLDNFNIRTYLFDDGRIHTHIGKATIMK